MLSNNGSLAYVMLLNLVAGRALCDLFTYTHKGDLEDETIWIAMSVIWSPLFS